MSSHDYVIVGAGSAGCVLANRLSAAGARVLLIEAGGSDRKLTVRAPAAFPGQFQTAVDWNFSSEPEPGLHGRRSYLPRGRMLGGTSSMNAMLYIRGNRTDYDRWESEHGATGWGYDSVLELFRRSERNAEIHDQYHGSDGELHVTSKRWLSNLWEPFVAAAAPTAGEQRNDDFNGARQDGAGLLQTTTHGGRRWNAADAFLRPAMKRENLDVVTGALVERVIFAGERATAVEYVRRGRRERAHAEREIVLSAGAYGSPQLLMLSGVGPQSHLREHGIEVLLDSPQVGRNLMEHPLAFFNWRSNDPGTLDDASSPVHLIRWLATKSGKISSTIAEAALHWRSDPALPAPDFQILYAPAFFWEHGFRKATTPCQSIGMSYIGPHSRGSVTLRSPDPAAPPRILNNMLMHDAEIEAYVRAMDLVREIAAREPFASSLGEELNPGPSLRTRDELVTWLRATCEHTYHPTCTCRIAGTPDEGVVDPQLRVHGLEGLRVADASVMPRVTGNTHAPTVMIAERCAELMLGAETLRPDVGASAQPAAA
jgi:choline dehydrogenase